MKHPQHNGLPFNADFDPLVGRKFTTVHIGKFWLQYLSEEPEKLDIAIGIEGAVIFTESGGKTTRIEDFAIGGGLLCQLIGLTIEKASRREEDGGLILDMSAGIRLEVVNEYPQYEAVTIHIGDNVIVG